VFPLPTVLPTFEGGVPQVVAGEGFIRSNEAEAGFRENFVTNKFDLTKPLVLLPYFDHMPGMAAEYKDDKDSFIRSCVDIDWVVDHGGVFFVVDGANRLRICLEEQMEFYFVLLNPATTFSQLECLSVYLNESSQSNNKTLDADKIRKINR
jgi:hypothetical protein